MAFLSFFRWNPFIKKRRLSFYPFSDGPNGEKIKHYAVYLRNISYYANLSHKGKIRFLSRIIRFMGSKNFVGYNGLEVTDEMRVLISASAVQLTYGLEKFIMPHYHTIRIYPKAFYSSLSEKYYKGGTNPNGTISFSWEDFVEGYKKPEDRYNLGLHEMAHALKLDVVEGDKFDERFANYLDNWEEIGKKEFVRIKEHEGSFLRPYAGTNMHEFFAVCVEHFFEVPLHFKKHLPDIYNHLCFLLNQDPSNAENDYQLKDNFATVIKRNKRLIPLPDKIKKNYKYSSWHWSLTILMIGIFICPFPIILFVVHILAPASSLLMLYLILVITGIMSHYRSLVKSEIMNFGVFIGYNLFGFAPLILTLCLALNAYVSISGERTEYHQIVHAHINTGSKLTMVHYADGAYEQYEVARSFSNIDPDRIRKGDYAKLTLQKGILGFTVLRSKELMGRNPMEEESR